MTLSDGFHDVPPGRLAMVVTYLEMPARAPLRDVPCPAGLTFRPLSRDVPTYRDLFRRVGQDWLWYARLRLSDAALAAIIKDTASVEIWTLEQDGRPEALLELDFRAPGACELAYFGLASKLMGTGAGAFLMDRAIERAWQREIGSFHVHTCTTDSQQALAFYRRSGFVITRTAVEIDADPRASGLHPPEAAPHAPFTGG